MLNQTFKLRLAVCDALSSPYMKEKLGTEWDDEVKQATEPVRLAILKVDDESVKNYWREWEKVFMGQVKPTVRPIDNDPMRAFIEVTF